MVRLRCLHFVLFRVTSASARTETPRILLPEPGAFLQAPEPLRELAAHEYQVRQAAVWRHPWISVYAVPVDWLLSRRNPWSCLEAAGLHGPLLLDNVLLGLHPLFQTKSIFYI